MRLSILFLVLLCYYSCHPPTQRMVDYEVHGIDISHYQSQIEWDSIAQQGIHFAFVKASEGEHLHDSLYCHNWKELERVGIKRGAYHFFHPSLPVERQVQNFCEQVDLAPGDLPPVLDVEVTGGMSPAMITARVHYWLTAIEAYYQVRPILYSNYNFYRRYLAEAFPDYPVWIARYSEIVPDLPTGQNWVFWQYGNRGELPGIDGHVDFNVFHGSLADLENICLPEPNPAMLSYKFNQ